MPVGGMMPVAKPPSGVEHGAVAWALEKQAVIVECAEATASP